MRVLREKDNREITLEGPLLARGEEASVYAVPNCPALAARIYHLPTAEYAGKLAAMLAAPPVPRTGTGHVAIAWPVERLLEAEAERRVVGYLMPRLEQAPLLWEVYNPGVRLQVYPQFHYGCLLRAARNLAGVVATLHQSGYVLGDLNESNVGVTPQALVTLIDVGSFQVPSGGQVYRCRASRPEYTPPELQGALAAEVDRRPEHDAFALAVLIFQLLMQGAHPFAGTCAESGELDSIPARIAAGSWPYAWERPGPCQPNPHAPPWSVLPPAVGELLRCCFEDARADPSRRPGAARWQQALEEAENDLTTCPQIHQHLYARGLDVCPWCLLARQQGRDPFPPLEKVQARRDEVPRPSVPEPVRTDGTGPVVGAANIPPVPVPVVVLLSPSNEPPPEPDLPQVPVEIPRQPRLTDLPVSGENPPGPATAPTGKPGWLEAGLRKVGTLVERRGWVAWFGAILVGTVAGLLWALDHPAPAAKDHTRPAAATTPGLASPSVSGDKREGEPVNISPQAGPVIISPQAGPPPSPLLPRPLVPGQGPAVPPPAPVAGGRTKEPIPGPPRPPLPEAPNPLQQARQAALEESRQAREAFSAAVRAYQAAAIGFQRGEVSQQEVTRCLLRLQEATRRVQAAGQAPRGSTSGRAAPLSP